MNPTVKIQNSRTIKPFYGDNIIPPPTTDYIPLSVFDKVNYETQVACIFAYRPPIPPNSVLELGLRKALAVFRPWAGRLSKDENENPIILLNDEGVKFVEASAGGKLDDETTSFEPSPSLWGFHQSTKGVAELVQIQLTRFECGSLVVGFVAHHLVGDGQATSNFLVAWGQATRGVDIKPTPFLDRSIFTPRDPPQFEFDHRGVEYMSRELKYIPTNVNLEDVEVLKIRYTKEFLGELKAKASFEVIKPYSTFESLLAHIWRTITKARDLNEDETTNVRVSVNGRMRLTPNTPNYFGNLVLWAFPTSKVKDLISQPLSHAAKVIHDSVSKVNDSYFKSFIDFANYKVQEEDLIPTADVTKPVLNPNICVDSWLRFQFYDLDFGTGCPFAFVPSYIPVEGLVFFLPASKEDGSVNVIVSLFKDKMATFKQICYCLD